MKDWLRRFKIKLAYRLLLPKNFPAMYEVKNGMHPAGENGPWVYFGLLNISPILKESINTSVELHDCDFVDLKTKKDLGESFYSKDNNWGETLNGY